MAESYSYSEWSTEVSFMDGPIWHVCTAGERQVLENYCCSISSTV